MLWREEMTHKCAPGLAQGGERITYANVGAPRSGVRANDVDQTDVGAERSARVTNSPFLWLIFCDYPNGALKPDLSSKISILRTSNCATISRDFGT